jgi:hypothetical protein
MARIDIGGLSWDDVEQESGELAWFVNPRLLGD